MQNVFLTKGHGYENHSTEGRCTAFDGFEIIASPLGGFDREARESRVYRWKPDPLGGTDYGSHVIALAIRPGRPRELYILMHHGGGREVWLIPQFFDGGALVEHIKAMPERLQYALLYSIHKGMSEAYHQGAAETRAEWAKAFHEKRIKTRRRNNCVYVEIMADWQVAEREREKANRAALKAASA